MLNQQITSSWNNSFCPPSLIVKDEVERPVKRRNEKFAVQSISSGVLLKGVTAVWKIEHEPKCQDKKELSPEATKAIALLDSWENEDAQAQKETWDYLVEALNEKRLSYRKLFP
jgi:hypothetical protein